MAWTHVRSDQGSFDSQAAASSPRRSGFDFRPSWRPTPETCLAAFVGVQVLQFGASWQGGMFDPVLAICQSVSLLAVTGIFAKNRTSQKLAAAPDLPAPLAPIAPASLAPAAQSEAHPVSAIAIDEQSQTWADLMARISHEIRTPLNAVIGFSDLMEREIFGPLGHERYRDYSAHIRDSGEALLRSAEDTLALSAMLAQTPADQRPQTSGLHALAMDAWLFVEPQASRRGILLSVSIAQSLEVAGDRRAFRQALSNLMIEAVQRAQSNTRVEIKAFVHGDSVRVKVSTPHAERHNRPAQPSLPMCVARALLELQGTSLASSDSQAQGRWQANTTLELVVQRDFFAAIEHTPQAALPA